MPSRFVKKAAGLLIPVFALREAGDLGIGDTVSMREALDFCHAQKYSVLQVLPINETSGDNSPYNAISSVALEPTLLRMSPEEVPGLLDEHLHALVYPEIRQELGGPAVDYPRVKRLKLDLLRLAFAHFGGAATPAQRQELDTFQRRHAPWLDSYALFRTLLDHHHGDPRWPLWAPSLRTPAEAEQWIAALAASEREEMDDRRAFYRFVQWIAYRQWTRTREHAERLGIKLMGDIPFGISRYSADVWAYQNLFDLQWSGGAPPERFFQSDRFTARWGQNWGIPIYPWEVHRAENYAWWRRRVEMTCHIFHAFRIDHVLGFFRVYSFPWTPERNQEFTDLSEEEAARHTGGRLPRFIPRPDEPPASGELNAADGRVLMQMIQEAAGKSIVVAEDLGQVPVYVRPLLRSMAIAGFTLPQVERNEDHSYVALETYSPINIITYATHDFEPLATWYDGVVKRWLGPNGDEGWHEICRLMDFIGWKHEDAPRLFTDALHQRLMQVMFESPCWVAMLMITDLLGTKPRFNEPGLVGTANWSQRLDRSLRQYLDDPSYAKRVQECTRLIGESGRA